MPNIFIDTNAWIALNHKNDQFHQKAIEINRKLLSQGFIYITTNYVMDEAYTLLMLRLNKAAAIELGEKIRISGLVKMVHVTESIEMKAWEVFKKFEDKNYSFTDCTSFVVMKDYKIQDAFTNDHHFEQMGFRRLLI